MEACCAVELTDLLTDELLQFPLLFERGVGSFWETRRGDRLRPQSATGALLTMHNYNMAMVFQSARLRYLGRLGQEWLLSQHSREVELWLNSWAQLQRKLQEKLVVQRRFRQRAGGDGNGEGEARRGRGAPLCHTQKTTKCFSLKYVFGYVYLCLSMCAT